MGETVQKAAQNREGRRLKDEVAARRNELFNKYIPPYYNMIYKLCINYSDYSEDVEDNYNIVLATLFKGIETYNPELKLTTWIHIVTKRQVFEMNRRRARIEQFDKDNDVHDICDSIYSDDTPSANCMCLDNYRELYSEDVLNALDSMKPMYRDALLLQMAGYSLQEITDIEYKKGNLSSYNIDTVKSRLFLARQCMRKMLTKDGNRKTN